jgi:septal ring factor EnvC (AmiA/AmiB activator)
MIGPKTGIAAGVVALALVLGYQSYSGWTAHKTTDARIAQLETELKSSRQLRETDIVRISELTAQLEDVQGRVGVTAADIVAAQKVAAAARKEQARAESDLRKSLEEQAQSVASFRDQSDAKLQAIQQEANTQIGQVTGQVSTVKTDLDATKNDLAANKREITDVRDSLGRQIARNADEVAALRRKGERDYFEFDLRKTKEMERVAGIRLQLTKADPKAKKYDVTVQVDDSKLQKKGQLLNEPITLNVGKDRVRYELVVNFIDKDHIRGYISTPKDSVGSGTAALQ